MRFLKGMKRELKNIQFIWLERIESMITMIHELLTTIAETGLIN